MKGLLTWWFAPKRFSSIIKILIGLIICFSFFEELITNTIDLIDAYVNPPLYLGTAYLLLPIITTLFSRAILWSGLFYLPYCIFGKRHEGNKRYLVPILIVVIIIGSISFGTAHTKPGTIEITRAQLALLEARLGEMNEIGEFYTLREYSYDIAELTEPIPDLFINEDEGFSKLVIFYKECEVRWKDLYILPTQPISIRENSRKIHLEEEAMLLFWGKYSESVFYRDSPEAKWLSNYLLGLFCYYGIDRRMHPAFADWTLPPK